ncbi:MAG: endonuclease III domain-containing protein [Chloroflexi bacterium]|nr:endonuclease III domain-containing protein [Chloroflexota bacterium]
MPVKPLRKGVLELYRNLLGRYGPQGWWPGESAFEVCSGAILTQATTWANVEKALRNLKEAGVFSLQALGAIPVEELARLLYPCGYFNVKARKLKAFAAHVGRHYGYDLDALLSKQPDVLREELLSVFGIGEETADAIVLYAAGKPSFVIDGYTRRILTRLGWTGKENSYRQHQAIFMDNLPADVALFNEYHALLVRHGKEVCRQKPTCERCCVWELCATGTARINVGSRTRSRVAPDQRWRT